MDLIKDALERAKQFEGFSSVPYTCPAGKITVGYGTNLQRRNFPDGVLLILGPILAASINTGCTVGRNWTGLVVTEETAGQLAREEIKHVEKAFIVAYGLNSAAGDPGAVKFPTQPRTVRLVLLDMAYNMGINSLLGFKRMFAALDVGDWDRAATELLDSKYARQVPERAASNADLIRGLGEGDRSIEQQIARLHVLHEKVDELLNRSYIAEVP
jgi:lysozyme